MSTTGSWITQDVRPSNKPQKVTARNIAFGKPFHAPPRLPLGLHILDLSKDAPTVPCYIQVDAPGGEIDSGEYWRCWFMAHHSSRQGTLRAQGTTTNPNSPGYLPHSVQYCQPNCNRQHEQRATITALSYLDA